jgi:acetyl-CoA carboxylase biotin carboxyl carrier protein
MAETKKKIGATVLSGESRAAAAAGSSLDVESLRQIVGILEASEVTRLVWTNGKEKISIRRGEPPMAPLTAPVGPAAMSSSGVHLPSQPFQPPPPGVGGRDLKPRPSTPSKGPEAVEKKGHVMTSPFVGTFYRTPAPEQPAYVEVGTVVKKGQVLCIVEAMKLMNEIESDVPGRVAEILVQNATPVEFGQPLFRIEPA